MKLFSCPRCSRRLYFENSLCLSCGEAVVYSPARREMIPAAHARPCRNAGECGCNWAGEDRFGFYCLACALNRTIPDLSVEGNRERWARVERAKRRVVHALLSFGLPVGPKAAPGDDAGLAFDFLADPAGPSPGGERVLTGHDAGLITLNVAEADAPERERMRLSLGERYRTVIGHFRHELGHYYWERLVRDDPARLGRFRALFGDERLDYAAALASHYEAGPRPDWQERNISAYAASHPWEDFAETWAHFLHIADTLETADAYRIPLEAADTATDASAAAAGPTQRMVARWLALSEIANAVNRSMGLPDLYPFVISPAVAEKLDFVRALLEDSGR